LHLPLAPARHAVPDEDAELAVKAQEWPRRLAELLADAHRRAVLEHKHHEAALKARRKELADVLAALAGQVRTGALWRWRRSAPMARRAVARCLLPAACCTCCQSLAGRCRR
jgi:hypothetical protein